MITIFRMSMIMCAAEPVIKKMSQNDEYNCRNKQPGFVTNKKLFHHKKNKAHRKNKKGKQAMMMSPVAMVQGIASDTEGQYDHACLKYNIIDDIDPE